VSPAVSATYTVTGTGFNSCTNTATVAVNVLPLPSVSVSPPSVSGLCQGLSQPLTASGTSVSYAWSPASGLDDDSIAAVQAAPTSSTTYTVTGTGANGCTAKDSVAVGVLPVAPITVTPPAAVCVQAQNPLVASGSVSGYQWSPSAGLNQTTGASVVATTDQLNPQLYTVTGSLANGCSTQGTVQVASTPVGGTVAPASAVVCSGASKAFTVAGQFGDTHWQSSTDNLNWSDIAGATANTYTLTNINQTVYVRALARTAACFDVASTSGVVYVSATPALTVTDSTATSVTVSWTPSSAADYTLSWSGAAGSGSQAAASSPFTVLNLQPNAALTVTVTKTSPPACPGTAAGTKLTHTRCAVPQNVVATAVTLPFAVQGLKVTWTAVAGATAYRVYYRPLAMNANWSFVDTANGTQKTIKPLYAGAPYAVMVAANNCPSAGQLGEASAVVYGVYTNTPPTGCGPIPTVLSATSTCPNQITVNLSGGPVWRVTLRRLSPSFSSGVTYQTASAVTNFTVATSTAGSVWEVFAVSVCGTVYSQISNVKTVTVKAPCEAPMNVVLSHPTCHGFSVAWNDLVCSGIPLVNYQVYIKSAAAANFISYNMGLTTHHTFPGPALFPNTQYSVYVRAFACNGVASVATPTLTVVTGNAGCRDADDQPEAQAAPAATAESVALYPNPTSGDFNVDVARTASEAAAVKIELVDALGRVLQTDYAATADGRGNFFVHPHVRPASGVYLVRVTVGTTAYTNRLVVQND